MKDERFGAAFNIDGVVSSALCEGDSGVAVHQVVAGATFDNIGAIDHINRVVEWAT